MSESKDVWKELRKQFPKEVIGVLPKPYKKDSPKGDCKVCGGYHGLPAAHLDYVGHAAVTDRLLEVDPTWTWEPLGTDERGIPAPDKAGNLWIKLTVNGVTRIGVGDGLNAKECISDAIRNAAMRFGVALDLWSKEELESTLADPALKNDKPSTRAEVPTTATGTVSHITPLQLSKIHAMFSDLGISAREERHEYTSKVIGKEIESSAQLSKEEASQLIESLQSDLEGVDAYHRETQE